jgi:peptidoglycan/LPS O-acetylase OafA/YrhL
MKQRLQFIDGLRGMAVLLTVLCHTWLYGGMYQTGPVLGGISLSYWFATAALGVNLFMVISGFCLTLPLVQADGWAELDVRDFFRRRILRIVPPYYAAIALFVLLDLLTPVFYAQLAPGHSTSFYRPSFVSVSGHLLFSYNIISTFVPNMPSIDGSFWSIELEAQFYLLLPLLILVARRCGMVKMVGGVLALTLAWRTLMWFLVAPIASGPVVNFLFTFAPARLFEFALGILAAVIFGRYRQRINPLLTLGLALLTLWVGVYFCYIKQGHFYPLTDSMVGAGFFFLLLAASVPGPAQRLFTYRPLTWVGLISYSVYLIHEPLVKELYTWFPGRQGLDAFITYSLIFTLLMVLAGYVFYRLVERPTMQWGRRLARYQPAPALVVDAIESHAAP